MYTGAVDWCANVQLAAEIAVPSAGAIWFGSAIGEIQGPASEAKGWITAFDADTGAVRWKFAAPAPVVAGVTPTAGGLVFTADLTGHLRAFDAESGACLFELETGQSIGGGIVSYSAGGEAANRRRVRDEVGDLARCGDREPNSGVRVAVVARSHCAAAWA